MSGYDLQLLGGFSLLDNNETLTAPSDAQRVLAHLALDGPSLPRSVVAGMLWPESSEDRASGSLRSALWRLRRVVPNLVNAEATHISLHPDVSVDVDQIKAAADRFGDPNLATEATENIDIRPFRRELLPGWYDDWVMFERERLRQLSVHTLESIARHLALQQRFSKAIDAAMGAIGIDPLRETPHRMLIAIHLAEGNRSEAVRHYGVYQTLLHDELGIEPTPALASLVQTGSVSSDVTFTHGFFAPDHHLVTLP
jgi:DNA-binding SARP family transcriptional activator